MSQNIFYALAAEHKQRTGHDIFNEATRLRNSCCDVCLYLKSEKHDQDRAEADYYRRAEVEHNAFKAWEEAQAKGGNDDPAKL